MSEAIDYYALPEQPARNLTPVPARGLIEISNVSKFFGKHKALDDVSLTLQPGTVTVILGPSGSGKSTLMNILGCLDKPSAGVYRVAGQDVATLSDDALAQLRREHFGFIFQRYHLLPHLSAAHNVEVPAVYAGLGKATRRERAEALLRRLGLGERVN